MKIFTTIVRRLKAFNYCCKALHLRWLGTSWLHFCRKIVIKILVISKKCALFSFLANMLINLVNLISQILWDTLTNSKSKQITYKSKLFEYIVHLELYNLSCNSRCSSQSSLLREKCPNTDFFLVRMDTFTAQKMKLSMKDFFSKCHQIRSSCGFGHIYWRNPSWKTSFFVPCFYAMQHWS